MPPTDAATVNEQILGAVSEQVADQQQSLSRLVDVALLSAGFSRLEKLLSAFPSNGAIDKLVSEQGDLVTEVQEQTVLISELAGVLAKLYELRDDLTLETANWVSAKLATPAQATRIDQCVLELITRTRSLLNARPDVAAVMDDLAALKELRGGPADAVAYHDFHVLQLATKSVWLHAFDAGLRSAVEQLYQTVVEHSTQSSVAMPPLDAIEDVSQLRELLVGLGASVAEAGGQPIPGNVRSAFPGSEAQWVRLSVDQQTALIACADSISDPMNNQAARDFFRALGKDYLAHPAGPVDRMSRLMLEIGTALNEPYAFDVYAPGTYNYGLLVTYRQKWEPQQYQAGQLVTTIPLAPMETRKFTKRIVRKDSVSRKMAEKTSSLRSLQSSETSRAESEIMERATTATNFKMTSNGSFNIGIGSMSVTNEFGGNTEALSSSNRKAFHEATLKAAEEYRMERSVEVDTTTMIESEETTSGEISNPNNEITVTYLFYELQRRYRIHEFLYRVRPVILVAQDVPEPQEIDEAWLVQYQWIIARVLLDETFRPALQYLTSGFAGDEVSAAVLQASWEKQRSIVENLEALTTSQLASRNALRELIVSQTLQKEELDNSMHGLGLLDNLQNSLRQGDWTFANLSKANASAEEIEANRRAAETRLKYMEEALEDAQEKLKNATSAFDASTKAYTTALQNKYTRHLAIDQLRVHVKQNILYYMQAIWAHEVPDQRYFKFHKMTAACPVPKATFTANLRNTVAVGAYNRIAVEFSVVPGSETDGGDDHDHELGVIADLDNPLGYKGNYIIFPLLETCPLVDYMFTDYVDGFLGVKDPDSSAPANFDPEEFDQRWKDAANDPAMRDELKKELVAYLSVARHSTDEIIVPTGNLFIEALPGTHPLLEDFKLLHRLEDVRKVKAEIRHAELENLRLGARLAAGQTNTGLLEDPDIEKKVVVEANASLAKV